MHILPRAGNNGRQGVHEVSQEMWQEGLLRHLRQADGDGVVEHLLRYVHHVEVHAGTHFVQAVWWEEKKTVLGQVFVGKNHEKYIH